MLVTRARPGGPAAARGSAQALPPARRLDRTLGQGGQAPLLGGARRGVGAVGVAVGPLMRRLVERRVGVSRPATTAGSTALCQAIALPTCSCCPR